MQEFVDFWLALSPGGQAVVVGIVTSAVVAAMQRLAPGLSVVPNQVKRAVIAVIAGMCAYASTGDVGAALAAALSAFGAYQVARATVQRR